MQLISKKKWILWKNLVIKIQLIIEKFDSDKEYAIVMELIDCNLKNKLDENPNGFQINEIKNILTQLNKTFRIMPNKKIIHRELN